MAFTLTNIQVDSGGVSITGDLSVPDVAYLPATGTGHFVVNGVSVSVTGWSVDQPYSAGQVFIVPSQTRVHVFLSAPILPTDVVTLSYTRSSNDITDGSTFLANFSGVAVTNRSTYNDHAATRRQFFGLLP